MGYVSFQEFFASGIAGSVVVHPGYSHDALCRVYRNLHKGTTERPVYSVQQYTAKGSPSGRKRWIVVAYATSILLADVRFKVDEKKRLKVIEEQRKNVHAYAVGHQLWGLVPHWLNQSGDKVGYNPYKGSSFTFNGKPVEGLPFVRLGQRVEGWAYGDYDDDDDGPYAACDACRSDRPRDWTLRALRAGEACEVGDCVPGDDF